MSRKTLWVIAGVVDAILWACLFLFLSAMVRDAIHQVQGWGRAFQ